MKLSYPIEHLKMRIFSSFSQAVKKPVDKTQFLKEMKVYAVVETPDGDKTYPAKELIVDTGSFGG